MERRGAEANQVSRFEMMNEFNYEYCLNSNPNIV